MTSNIDRLLLLPRYASDGIGAIKPGFERIEALLEGMGNPQHQFQVALVAGTNGKGSTASMMAACLTAAGFRTALHTSPHLLHVSERMRVDGKAPPDAWLEQACGRYFDLFETAGASFFEATLALSLLWFADQGATHAVVEVGLGGRLDATNVLPAAVSVITGIALDHTDILGDTITKIALEKAGIIKPGKPVIVGKMPSDAVQAISNAAATKDAPVLIAEHLVSVQPQADGRLRIRLEDEYVENVTLGLLGSHQLGNAAVAICAVRAWLPSVGFPSIKQGLEHVQRLTGLRGRAEVLHTDPLLMVDVAHNPDAIATAVAAFKQARSGSFVPVVIIGLLADKDAIEIGRELASTEMEVWTVPTEGARGLGSENLSELLTSVGASVSQSFKSTKDAVRQARSTSKDCLVCGSHLVVMEAIGPSGL